MKVYGDIQSGNCYKIKLLLSLLNIEHEWLHVNILNAETKTTEFLQMNPNGKIPVLVLDDDKVLMESNAILGYLAEYTSFIPSDRYKKAKMYEWLFFEQYSHEPSIAVARFINIYLGLPKERLEEYNNLQPKGNKALSIMEQALSKNKYLVGDSISLADISLYAYTHVANEGGFDLNIYPNIQLWCDRIKNTERYVAM